MTRRKRIVILGGGIGALTTAYHLSSVPDWRERYDITLYQMGWRLGGKCASSRNPEHGLRIEEHGLHVWFGFYENAFRMMRECYRELDRPPGSALSRLDEAFSGQTLVSMLEQCGTEAEPQWTRWIVPFRHPLIPGRPGTDEGLQAPDGGGPAADHLQATSHWDIPRRLLARMIDWLEDPELAEHTQESVAAPLRRLQERLQAHDRAGTVERLAVEIIIGELKALRFTLHECLKLAAVAIPQLRRVRLMVDLGLTVVIGMLQDDLFRHGIGSIDHLDLREWLRLHGAAGETIHSVLLRALYDCCFAYRDGEMARPDFAAGAALGCALRIALMWRGKVFYLMNAGMGDIVVAPLYEVLTRRGVKFEFFQKVRKLELDPQRHRVARIHFGRQATVKPECGTYDPLLRSAQLSYPCWPHAPLLEQLVEGEALQGVNLESHWSQWQDAENWTLELEPDDDVVLGISLGALAPICGELAEANVDWRNMLEQLPTMQTQSAQLWFTKDQQDLGWNNPGYPDDTRPVMVAAPELLDVWADMSHGLTQERWGESPPRCVQYFCGPLPGDLVRHRARDDASVPEVALAQVRAEALRWFGTYTRMLWPGAAQADGEGLDWNLLHHAGGAQGPARLDGQYLRANIDPSERYVLSPKGANKLRLRADRSGFDNLYLAGDWTHTAINAGCVEATVMSGMTASRALCGFPQRIHGEHFLQGVPAEAPPLKVVVLGSGCGALSAAYWLSHTEELRRRYQVTVYAPGWRLGGKGASGRDQAGHNCIHEHGLHLMMGFYETTFRVIRDCYDTMEKPPKAVFKSWRDAFEEQYRITLWRQHDGNAGRVQLRPWNLEFPSRPGLPGDGLTQLESDPQWLTHLAHQLLNWLVGEGMPAAAGRPQHDPAPPSGSLLRSVFARVCETETASGAEADFLLVCFTRHAVRAPLEYVEEHWRSLHTDLRECHDWLHRVGASPQGAGPFGKGLFSSDWHHDLVLLNLSMAALRGLLEDVLPHGLDGFARIDHLDFKDWLRSHGAWDEAARDPLVMCLYDLAFAYEDGDSSSPEHGKAAAGALLRLILRMAFTYRGAPLWKMRAGMGDVIFTPLYQTLKQRGVRFEFFHRVEEVHVAAESRCITGVDLQRQARLKDDAYRPLLRIADADGGNSWDYWPAEPLWDQLVDGAALKRRHVDFEDPWTLQPADPRRLELGRDFDAVVFGIPPAAAAPITKQLSRASKGWADMLGNSASVATLSAQLWLKPDLERLGWPHGVTVSTTFADPLRSWGEMSQVLGTEQWPQGAAPRSCEYLCGTFKPAQAQPAAGTSDPAYIPSQNQVVEQIGRTWFAAHGGTLWPNACDAGGALDWQQVAGVYWRANVAWSELYVQSPPGTLRYRLDPGGSGFDNLFLAGDWTRTSLNGGCAEAAFESGMLAARAITQKVFR